MKTITKYELINITFDIPYEVDDAEVFPLAGEELQRTTQEHVQYCITAPQQ